MTKAKILARLRTIHETVYNATEALETIPITPETADRLNFAYEQMTLVDVALTALMETPWWIQKEAPENVPDSR